MTAKLSSLALGVVALIAWQGCAPPDASSPRGQLVGLPFEDDYPTAETTRALDEELYFQRAVQTYLWSLPAVNMFAMKEGQAKTFGEGYQVLAIFEKRLKPNTLITTPNSDVIYGIGFLDLSKDGPMVIDAPPMLQG